MRDSYVNRQTETKDTQQPVAFAAHRYGTWGYIWHTEDDVAEWIKISNSKIKDSNSWWHGPVPLFDQKTT